MLGRALLGAIISEKQAAALDLIRQGASTVERAAEGSRWDKRKVDDYTALMLASMSGQADVAKALLEAGAEPDAEASSFKVRALSLAVKSPVIVGLLLGAGADPNRCDRMGGTPLMEAARLAMGRAPGSRLGLTPEERHLREMPDCALSMRLLLSAGARTDARDFFGHTAASCCVHNDDPIRLKLLLDAGVKAGDSAGGVAQGESIGLMEIAAKVGAYKCAKVLLDAGIDPREPNARGETPLFWALASEWPECAKLFGDRGWGMDDRAFRSMAENRVPARKVEEALKRAALLEERRSIGAVCARADGARSKRSAL